MRVMEETARRRAMRWAVAVTVWAAAVALAAQTAVPPREAQGPQVTFKVDINYVEIAARVVDRQDRFVPDLQQTDFRVTEDGVSQTIVTFGVVEMPVERLETALFVRAPIEPDVRGNARPFDGRVYIIVLDDLHTEFQNSRAMKLAAREFIEKSVGANDLAAVVSTSGRTDASQEFTPSKPLLLAAVDRFAGRGLRSATLSKLDTLSTNTEARRGAKTPELGRPDSDTESPERAQAARATLSMVRRLSELMAGIHGRRKALVLFSEGIDYNINSAMAASRPVGVRPESRDGVVGSGPARDVQMDARETIAAAARANVAIYGIDPRGLSVAGGAADLGLIPLDADPSLKLNLQGVESEQVLQRFSLQTLAEGTGGFAAVNTSDLAGAFERIRQENSTYYVLGYYPTNTKRDGKFRTVDVRVTRPGLLVRTRQGYVAPIGRTPVLPAVGASARIPAPLRAVLGSPLQVSGLRMTVLAAPFRGPGPDAAVTVVLHTDGRDLQFRERDGIFEGAVELSVIALNSQGKTKADLHRVVPMPLKPESRTMVEQHGIRIVSRLDLPPGRYQLRVAAMDVGNQRAGSVHYDLEVPDFEALPLSMSGLLVTSSLAGMVPTAGGGAVDDLRKTLPGPPAVSREFRAGEELALMAEVYDNEASTPHTVDITASVRTDEGLEIYRHEDQRASTELSGSRGVFGYAARVPLKGAQPGLYVLRVEARSRLGERAPVGRELQFRIVP